MMHDLIILGIDPGSRVTGYGIILQHGNKIAYLDSGCIRTESKAISERLAEIYRGISTLVQQYKPHEMAIEEVFVHHNVSAALKLGQARGAAIVATARDNIPVFEYSARYIKRALVGYGAAEKHQVKDMVMKILSLNKAPQTDAADALAIAICHSNSRKNILQLNNLR